MFEKLEQAIGYTFRDKSLLKLAMTHPSYAGETHVHNQRLEFLGDAVLQLCTSVRLYKQYPDLPEGKLSRLRARCVQESALEVAARRLHLGENLLLGIGEERGGGREKPSILADAMEALLGAMYLDGGMEDARRLIEAVVPIADAAARARLQDRVPGTGAVRDRGNARLPHRRGGGACAHAHLLCGGRALRGRHRARRGQQQKARRAAGRARRAEPAGTVRAEHCD